jgi:phosphomannomutase/dTDP-glucose pyrophosphorylase
MPGPQGQRYVPAFEPLGDRRVIDHVLEHAARWVDADDLVIIVDEHEATTFEEQVCGAHTVVVQTAGRGTGSAVLAARDLLAARREDDLLILYGDMPLLSSASIAGLLRRHRLTEATLTFLTATVRDSTDHGRVVRSDGQRAVEIVEAVDASEQTLWLAEVNVGAYAARSGPILDALEALQRQKPGDVALTDCVQELTRAGHHVETHHSVDPDEAVGVDRPGDLARAEFLLEERAVRPLVYEVDPNIRFGTGGWRAIIGEGFTFGNLRRLCQALADHMVMEGSDGQGVIIGCDRRFLGERAVGVAAEVFAGNGVPTAVLAEPVPTPLVTYATVAHGARLGLIVTASHNPYAWNGVKVFREDGALLLDDETERIERAANALRPSDVVKVDLDLALAAGMVGYCDYSNEYIDAVEAHIDLDVLRAARIRVVIDLMHGSGTPTLERILGDARCNVTTLRTNRDPLFGGMSPAPELEALNGLMSAVSMVRGDELLRFSLGMAMDGDADRIAMVDECGGYVHVNDILLLLYAYLHETRGMRGGVVRNVATTHLLDRLAASYGEGVVETPVGFKHIVEAMQRTNALLGGESSGGLTIAGHILGKDGILAAMLLLEMLAVTQEPITALLARIYEVTGRLHSVEAAIVATPAMRVLVPKRLREAPPEHIADQMVRDVNLLDGHKFTLDDGSWLLLRFSGTEPKLRIVAESGAEERAAELVSWARDFVERQRAP